MTDAIPVHPERCKFCNCELPELNPNLNPECRSYETARLERDRLFRKAAMREIDIQELARDLQKKLTEIVSNATAEDEECPGSGNITAIIGAAEDALARIREEFPK